MKSAKVRKFGFPRTTSLRNTSRCRQLNGNTVPRLSSAHRVHWSDIGLSFRAPQKTAPMPQILSATRDSWSDCRVIDRREFGLPLSREKAAIPAAVEARAEPTWQAAVKIWEWAEPGYQEAKSSALLADMLEREGFQVARRRRTDSHRIYRHRRQRTSRDRHPGRVRRAAGLVSGRGARARTAPRQWLWTRMWPSPVWRGVGVGRDRRGRAVEEGSAHRHGSLLRLPSRGGGRGQGLHGPRGAFQ